MVQISQYIQQFNPAVNNKNVQQKRFHSLPGLTFRGNLSEDTFTRSNYTVLEQNEELFTPAVKEDIKSILDSAKNDTMYRFDSWKLGNGYQGNAYEIPGTDIAVKLSHTKKRGSKPTALNCDFVNESKMLKRMPLKGTHNQKLIARLKIKEGLYALVTTKVEGQPLNERHMNETVLKSLLDEMFVLDKARIMHCDLRNDNILLDDGILGIIDYGSSFEFDQFVEPYNIKYGDDFYQHPVFWPPSNVRFFDFHTIYPTYCELARNENDHGEAKKFITGYLKQRSHYHQKRADLFREELQNNKSLDVKQVDQLKKSIRYEQLQTKIFENPSKKFIDLELDKIYIDKLAHDALKGRFDGEPLKTLIARKQELIAIEEYKEEIKDILESDELKDYEKEYLRFQKRFADFYEFDVAKPTLKKELAEFLGEKSINSEAVDLILNHLSKQSRLSLSNRLIHDIAQKALSLVGSISSSKDYELRQLLDA